jgi:transcription initiation factor IIE alpha subunit
MTKKKQTINMMTAQDMMQRISEIVLTFKNQGLAQTLKSAASKALAENNISALKSLLIIALAAQCDEELISSKVEHEGLFFDPLSKEFLSEFDADKAIADLNRTIDQIQAEVQKRSNKIDQKLK